jgi:hypothetical protein
LGLRHGRGEHQGEQGAGELADQVFHGGFSVSSGGKIMQRTRLEKATLVPKYGTATSPHKPLFQRRIAIFLSHRHGQGEIGGLASARTKITCGEASS